MEEGGTNVRLSDAVEKGANARPGAPLEDGYTCGTAPDGFARANECAAEPAAAVEGDARAGASTAAACEANASPGAPLEGGYASGTAPDGFVKVKEGEACRGMHRGNHSGGVCSQSRHSGTGKYICSDRDRIRLCALARSLAPGIWINVFAGALAFNRADVLCAHVSTTDWAVFTFQGFSISHAFGRFGPGLPIWIEDISFG